MLGSFSRAAPLGATTSPHLRFPRQPSRIGKQPHPPTPSPGPHYFEPDHCPRGRRGVTEGRGVAATRGPATAGTFAPARCSSLKDPDLKRQALQPSWLSAACGRRVRDLRCAPEPGRQLYDFGFQDSLLTNPPCPQPKRTVPTPKTTSLATHKTFQPVVRPRSVSWVLPPSEKKACSVIPGRRSKTT